jgi:preprotein translocase subunit YajC
MFSCAGFPVLGPNDFTTLAWLLVAQDAAPPGGPLDSLFRGPWLPFLMIGILFYLLMIRPERRKRAELAQMLANLKKNDRVVTIGGIFGTVVNVQQGVDEVTVKVDEGSNTRLRMQRSAIARVLNAEASAAGKNSL